VAEPTIIKLWDWPVRLIHWAMALLLPALWWTAEEGMIEQHRLLGLILLGLVIFRLIWGFVGSESARFRNFLRGPAAVRAYLRGEGPVRPGHNPLGGWSVAALLAVLCTQLGLGLVAQDEYGLVAGPLNSLLSFDAAETATEWHEALFNGILALTALHIAAIAYYQIIRRDNIIRPMLTGRKDVAADTEPLRPATRLATMMAVAAALAVTGWIALGAPPFTG
jgi:cytochrome b